MPATSIRNIASDVAAILGEILAPDCRPEESPWPGIYERVKIVAPVFLKELLMETDTALLDELKPLEEDFSIDDEGVVTLNLADDFLKLAYLRMSGWEKPVSRITEEKDFKIGLQSSRWKGIRGNCSRPVAVLSFSKGRRKCLKLFSCSPDAKMTVGLYVALPAVTSDDSLAIPSSLYSSLTVRLAESLKSDSF